MCLGRAQAVSLLVPSPACLGPSLVAGVVITKQDCQRKGEIACDLRLCLRSAADTAEPVRRGYICVRQDIGGRIGDDDAPCLRRRIGGDATQKLRSSRMAQQNIRKRPLFLRLSPSHKTVHQSNTPGVVRFEGALTGDAATLIKRGRERPFYRIPAPTPPCMSGRLAAVRNPDIFRHCGRRHGR